MLTRVIVCFFLKCSTKPGSVPMPPVSLSESLPPSRVPVLDNCSLLCKPVVRVPVSVSVSRSTRLSGSLSFSEPSGLSLDSDFSISNLAPSLAQLSLQRPPRRSTGCSADPGSTIYRDRRPRRPQPDPGGGRGRVASAPFPAGGRGPGAGIRATLGRELTSKPAVGAGSGVRRG